MHWMWTLAHSANSGSSHSNRRRLPLRLAVSKMSSSRMKKRMLNNQVRGENSVKMPMAVARVMMAVSRWFGCSRRSMAYMAASTANAIVARKMRSPNRPKAWHRPYNSRSANQL